MELELGVEKTRVARRKFVRNERKKGNQKMRSGGGLYRPQDRASRSTLEGILNRFCHCSFGRCWPMRMNQKEGNGCSVDATSKPATSDSAVSDNSEYLLAYPDLSHTTATEPEDVDKSQNSLRRWSCWSINFPRRTDESSSQHCIYVSI